MIGCRKKIEGRKVRREETESLESVEMMAGQLQESSLHLFYSEMDSVDSSCARVWVLAVHRNQEKIIVTHSKNSVIVLCSHHHSLTKILRSREAHTDVDTTSQRRSIDSNSAKM